MRHSGIARDLDDKRFTNMEDHAADPSRFYRIVMIVLAFIGLIGIGAAILLPAAEPAPGAGVPAPATGYRP